MAEARRGSGGADAPLVPGLVSLLASSDTDTDDDTPLTKSIPIKSSLSAGASAGDAPLSAGGSASTRRLLLSPLSMGGSFNSGPVTPSLTVRLAAPVEGCALQPFVRARLPLAAASGSAGGSAPSAEAIAASVLTESDPRLSFAWYALRRVELSADSTAAASSLSTTSSSRQPRSSPAACPPLPLSACAYSCCPGPPPQQQQQQQQQRGASGGSTAPLPHSGNGGRSSGSSAAAWGAHGVVNSIVGGGVDGWGWDGVGHVAGLQRALHAWEQPRSRTGTDRSESPVPGDSVLPPGVTRTGPTRTSAPLPPRPAGTGDDDGTMYLRFHCAICEALAHARGDGAAASSPAPSPVVVEKKDLLLAGAAASSSASSSSSSSSSTLSFCSVRCLVAGWKEHAQYHAAGSRASSSGSVGRAALDTVAPSSSAAAQPEWRGMWRWEHVSSSRSYTPTPRDIGRPLKHVVSLHLGPTSSSSSSSSSSVSVSSVRSVGRSLDFTAPEGCPEPAPPLASGWGSGTPHSGDGDVLVQEVVTRPVLPLPPGPPPRQWVRIPTPGLGPVVRLLCWNVLAEVYATGDAYPSVPSWALAWPFRCRRILAEITAQDPDIIALQEVQADAYAADLLPALSERGYAGTYKPKTREAMGSAGRIDGCALFWRSSALSLVEAGELEYDAEAGKLIGAHTRRIADLVAGGMVTPGQAAAAVEAVSSRLGKRLMKGNVAQTAVLVVHGGTPSSPPPASSSVPHGGGCVVVVANTHILADVGCPEVKLWQAAVLARACAALRARYTTLPAVPGGGPAPPPLGRPGVILAGDLNSEPGSAVHALLTHAWEHAVGNHPALPPFSTVASGRLQESRPGGVPLTWGDGSTPDHEAEASPPGPFPPGLPLPPDPAGVLAAFVHYCAAAAAASTGTDSGSGTNGGQGQGASAAGADESPLPLPLLIPRALPLASAYAAVTGSEPAYTNYTGGYRGALDHVLVTPDTVRPLATLAVPHPALLVPWLPGVAMNVPAPPDGAPPSSAHWDAVGSGLCVRPLEGPPGAGVNLNSGPHVRLGAGHLHYTPAALDRACAAAAAVSASLPLLGEAQLPGGGSEEMPPGPFPLFLGGSESGAGGGGAGAGAGEGEGGAGGGMPLRRARGATGDSTGSEGRAGAPPGSSIGSSLGGEPPSASPIITLPSPHWPSDHIPLVVDLAVGEPALLPPTRPQVLPPHPPQLPGDTTGHATLTGHAAASSSSSSSRPALGPYGSRSSVSFTAAATTTAPPTGGGVYGSGGRGGGGAQAGGWGTGGRGDGGAARIRGGGTASAPSATGGGGGGSGGPPPPLPPPPPLSAAEARQAVALVDALLHPVHHHHHHHHQYPHQYQQHQQQQQQQSSSPALYAQGGTGSVGGGGQYHHDPGYDPGAGASGGLGAAAAGAGEGGGSGPLSLLALLLRAQNQAQEEASPPPPTGNSSAGSSAGSSASMGPEDLRAAILSRLTFGAPPPAPPPASASVSSSSLSSSSSSGGRGRAGSLIADPAVLASSVHLPPPGPGPASGSLPALGSAAGAALLAQLLQQQAGAAQQASSSVGFASGSAQAAAAAALARWQ